jgi:hypothetical protein
MSDKRGSRSAGVRRMECDRIVLIDELDMCKMLVRRYVEQYVAICRGMVRAATQGPGRTERRAGEMRWSTRRAVLQDIYNECGSDRYGDDRIDDKRSIRDVQHTLG